MYLTDFLVIGHLLVRKTFGSLGIDYRVCETIRRRSETREKHGHISFDGCIWYWLMGLSCSAIFSTTLSFGSVHFSI